jgi:aspartate racemase
MKTLRLIGGTSWYSTVDYYRHINQAINEAYGNTTKLPVILYNMNQERIHELQASGLWDEIAALLAQAAIWSRAGGAQAILICANTPHKVYAQVARKTDMPLLHIGEATRVAIRNAGLKKVALIGTLYTIEDGFMADWLNQQYGIKTLVPRSAAVRQELHRIIQEELSRGVFKAESKRYVLQQIEELRQRKAQGIVLGCTEFPLIIKPSDLGFPLFDTTRLHSQRAVDFILGKQGLVHVRTDQ